MTEFLIYCFFGAVFFLFFVVLNGGKQKRHNWHEVDSAKIALLTRKSKGRRK